MPTWATRNTKHGEEARERSTRKKHEKEARENGAGNSRNGKISKRILREQGELEIEAPVIATDRSNPGSSRAAVALRWNEKYPQIIGPRARNRARDTLCSSANRNYQASVAKS